MTFFSVLLIWSILGQNMFSVKLEFLSFGLFTFWPFSFFYHSLNIHYGFCHIFHIAVVDGGAQTLAPCSASECDIHYAIAPRHSDNFPGAGFSPHLESISFKSFSVPMPPILDLTRLFLRTWCRIVSDSTSDQTLKQTGLEPVLPGPENFFRTSRTAGLAW